MSSFNAPSTPSRTRRAPTSPTGLYVTFVSVIQDVVIPGFSEQFIDYGSVVLILLVGASIPNEGFNWEKANTFFRNTELCLHAHLFSRQALSWPMKEQSPFIVSGDLSPWGVRTAVGEKPEDTLMYQTIIMPTEETLHRLTLDLNVDSVGGAVQTQGIQCDFVGRVCGFPSGGSDKLTMKGTARPLLEVGIFVNLNFWLRRPTSDRDQRDDRLRKGVYQTYVFLIFDKSARNRFGWALDNGRINLAVGSMIHCVGTISGQIKEEWVQAAGYETGTPVEQSPIFVITPTGTLRLADQQAPGRTIDAAAVSSPPTETFMSKLERARAMHNRGREPKNNGESSGSSGLQQPIKPTVTEHDNDSDVTVKSSSAVDQGNAGEPVREDSPSVQLMANRAAPETDEHNGDGVDTVDDQSPNDKGLLKKRRRRF